MKRSRTITLAFMAGAALTLTACSEDADTQDMGELYRDRQACMAQNSMTECDRAFEEAKREHAANAPRFGSQAECEAQFGPAGCQQQANAGGGSSFLPLMMGYMLGSAMNNNRPTPAYYAPGSYRDRDRDSRPVYSSGAGAAAGTAASQRPLGYAGTSSTGRTSVFSPSARTGGAPSSTAMRATTSTRGGVGTTAAARGSAATS